MNRSFIAVFCSLILCASQSAAELTSQPISVRFPVAFEAPYKLGARPALRDKQRAEEDRIVLARWNEGGRSGSWHPAPRVIVDNPRVTGPIQPASVLRIARAKGYWLIRRCYDAALVDKPDLRGKLTVSFTIRQRGTVARPAITGKPTLADDKAVQCIRRSMSSLPFPRLRRDARATIDIQVNPGDAPVPVPRDETPGPGHVDAPLAQGVLAAGAGAAVQQCFVQGAQRVPGLWGRLVLLADVAEDGTIRGLSESESTFPDPQTTRCVSDAVRAVRLPPPNGGDVRIMIPIRFGDAQS